MSNKTSGVLIVIIIIGLLAGIFIGRSCKKVPEIDETTKPAISDSVIKAYDNSFDSIVVITDSADADDIEYIREATFNIDSNTIFTAIHSYSKQDPEGKIMGLYTRKYPETTPIINYPINNSCLSTAKTITITSLITAVVVVGTAWYLGEKFDIIK